jgi:anti-sigma B factor antagonist
VSENRVLSRFHRIPAAGMKMTFPALCLLEVAPVATAMIGDLPMAFQSRFSYPHFETEKDATIIHFSGCNVALDELALAPIRDLLFALGEQRNRSRLILDFSNVDQVSGSTLATLVTLHEKLQATGRHLILRNPSPRVRELLAATRLDKFLNLRPAEARTESSSAGRVPYFDASSRRSVNDVSPDSKTR